MLPPRRRSDILKFSDVNVFKILSSGFCRFVLIEGFIRGSWMGSSLKPFDNDDVFGSKCFMAPFSSFWVISGFIGLRILSFL